MNDELLLEDTTLKTFSFLEYRALQEGFTNFLPSDTEEKTKHSAAVFDMIQKAYSDQGGIKGSGFKTPQDMVDNIPMWKLAKKSGNIKAVALYKENNGRKRVAMASDGTANGKKAAGEIMSADLKQSRSHMEISGKSLSFMKKQIDVLDHVHSYESAEKIHKRNGDSISRPREDDLEVARHPELKDNFYVRKIGNEKHTKVMLGSTNKTITEDFVGDMKEKEKADGASSTLRPGKHQYGNWEMDTQIHGPARANLRQPDWKEDDWHDLLSRSHEALTNPSKHISKPAKLTSDSVLVYSKKKQQGVVLRIVPKDRDNIKRGGSTRIETVLPKKSSIAKEGTQRIVIENITYEVGVNLIIIE